MKIPELSINRACILFGLLFTMISAIMLIVLFLQTDSIESVIIGSVFASAIMLSIAWFVYFIRNRLILFSEAMCEMVDNMIVGNMKLLEPEPEESLFYKINYRLIRLFEIIQKNNRDIKKEKTDLQELISDISHQVKTPISNLKMINSILLEQNIPMKKQHEFIEASSIQLDKLEFLMQALIKTSRLETGIISLQVRKYAIYDTIASALGNILLQADKKHICVRVDCPEYIEVLHDRKWTTEAIFNLLDNAVKYTPEGGDISVSVECWGLYVKISITDSGKGISENHQGKIFNRFYREDEIHEVEGLGIGLYLTREIISKQDGYIKVDSKVGEGSTFSVFLPLA